MESRVAFACEREGLADALRGGLLGGYDGTGSWSVFIERVVDKDENLMVQVHEALHHELQSSTAWGCLTGMAGLLAERGLRPHALREVFDHGVERSTEVHELYATFLAGALAALRGGGDPLEGNPRYRAFRERARALVPVDGISDSVQLPAVAAVLRCCMSPAGLGPVCSGLDFERLSSAELDRAVPAGPDRRLQAFEAAAGEREHWRALLEELAALDPGHQEQILAQRRPTTLADMSALEEQWRFETEVVQRRCYELAAALLERGGERTLPWAALGEATAAVARAAVAADPELSEIVRVGDPAPTAAVADVLEFSRQRISLRAPLPLELLTDEERRTLRLKTAFLVQAGSADEHICAFWVTPAILQKQFAAGHVPADLRACLFTRARDEQGGPVARIGVIAPERTPRELQEAIAPTPLLVLTTHMTLVDDEVGAALGTVEPVFVWMDLPVGWHVDHWVSQGGRVRYAIATVDAEKELGLLALAVDRAPAMRFFHIGGLVALGSLLERLRQRHDDDTVGHDQALLTDEVAGFTMAANHVLHTFSVLDQDGSS